jgi:excisionase family DNA binding protein
MRPRGAHLKHTENNSTMDLIGVEQVASILGVSASTVRWWRQTGKGPRSARIGKHVKFKRADVEAWADAQFESELESKSVDFQFKPLGRRQVAGVGHE